MEKIESYLLTKDVSGVSSQKCVCKTFNSYFVASSILALPKVLMIYPFDYF